MEFTARCEGATVAVVNTGNLATDCSTAGGVLGWYESAGVLPDLSIADGGLIAGAMLALWATAWAIRAIRRHLWEL